jgi:hypothetical protein
LIEIHIKLVEIGAGSEEFRDWNRPFDDEPTSLKTRLTAPREAP